MTDAFQEDMVNAVIEIATRHGATAEEAARVLHSMAKAATEAWQDEAQSPHKAALVSDATSMAVKAAEAGDWLGAMQFTELAKKLESKQESLGPEIHAAMSRGSHEYL